MNTNPLGNREKAAEDAYIRQREAEKAAAAKKQKEEAEKAAAAKANK